MAVIGPLKFLKLISRKIWVTDKNVILLSQKKSFHVKFQGLYLASKVVRIGMYCISDVCIYYVSKTDTFISRTQSFAGFPSVKAACEASSQFVWQRKEAKYKGENAIPNVVSIEIQKTHVTILQGLEKKNELFENVIFKEIKYMVWKFHDSSVIQILREIKVGESRGSKSAILHFWGSWFC